VARYWLVAVLVAVGFLIWRRLASPPRTRSRPQQALILTLRLADATTPPSVVHERLEQVDRALRAAIGARREGEVEEPVAAGVDCVYTCYGDDADRLLDAARAGLSDVPLLPGSYAVRRFGPPGAPEERSEFR
jgi:hypothetical protein